MQLIIKEIDQALKYGLWYAATALALTLPDICASLEASPKARKDGQKARYLSWCRRNLLKEYSLRGDICWELRSGVVHEGRYKNREFDRVVLTTPDGGGVHNCVIQSGEHKILILNVLMLCSGIVKNVIAWYETNKDDKNVLANMPSLVRSQEDGLLPTIKGTHTIG